MKSYSVTSDMAGDDGKRRALRVLFAAGSFTAFQILMEEIWPFGRKMLSTGGIIAAVVGGVVFALLFEITFVRRFYPYTLVVSDDSITAVFPHFERTVRRAEARTVTETNGSAFHCAALRISKHGRLGTWFWGCIWIPKTLIKLEPNSRLNAVTDKVGASTRSGFSDVLLNHDSSVFVLTQPNEL